MEKHFSIIVLLLALYDYQERLGNSVCDVDNEITAPSHKKPWKHPELKKLHEQVYEFENIKEIVETGVKEYLRVKERFDKGGIHEGNCRKDRDKNEGTYNCDQCLYDHYIEEAEKVERLVEELILKNI